MNQNSNQRCSCFCRPQIPAPPCTNTDCRCEPCGQCSHCDDQFLPPPAPMPMPQTRPPMPPMAPAPQPANTSVLQPGVAGASVRQPNTQTLSMTHSGGCGCGSGQPLTPNTGLEQMPIGMGYVPWQRWGQTYPVEQGFVRGTLFPELDLPFVMGRCRG